MCFVCEMRGSEGVLKPLSDGLVIHVSPAFSVQGAVFGLLSTSGDFGLLGGSTPAHLIDSEFGAPDHDDLFGRSLDNGFGDGVTFNTDTVPGDTTTSATLTIGGAAVSGAIEVSGDADWFRMQLVAGQTYTFFTGNGSTGGMDTTLTLRNVTGTQIAFNDDSNGLLSVITFTATTSGTYYLDVGGWSTSTGTYTVRAVINEPDAVAGDTTTTATVSIGGSVTGEIGAAGDQDWYRVDLVAGQTYRFSTSGGTTGANLSDADLVLRNASGTQVDIDTTGTTASILFTATTSGTYFLDVRGAGSSAGGFTLTAATAAPLQVATNDEIARHLTHDFWGGSSHRYNVGPGGTLTVNLTGLTAEGLFLAREALALWTDVTGILFSEVTSGGQMVFDDNESGAFASASHSGGITSTARVNVSTDWLVTNGTGLNSYSFQTYVHEIGHALGLGHGGHYNGTAGYDNDARFLNDSWGTTIMSYYDPVENTYFGSRGFTYQFVLTPMAADAIGTVSLYGVATTTRTGNTTYGFNNNSGRAIYDSAQFANAGYTVFDHGGVDTLDYSGFAADQRIDLRAEQFSNVGGRTGNVVIARGTVIENAIGGSGNDTLIGNSANNLLIGNGGSDTAVFSGNRASYTLSFMEAGRYVVRGPDGTDTTISVERLQFANVTVSGPAALFEQTLYQAANNFGAGPAGGGWASYGDFPRVVGDINGDGRADIIGFGAAGTYVSLGQANGTFGTILQVNAEFGQSNAGGGWASYDRFPRMVADVNGDGRADIVGFGDAGTYVALANGSGGFGALALAVSNFGTTAGGWSSQNLYHRTMGDVNGDGRADIIGFGEAGTYVALGAANGSFAAPTLAVAQFGRGAEAGGWTSHDLYARMVGDINNDGRADLIGFGGAGTYVALGNANGTFGSLTLAINEFGTATGWSSQDRYPRMIADVNGDGFDDIIGFGEAGVYYALNNGAGGFGTVALGYAQYGNGAGGWASSNRYPRLLGDVNGDGLADIIGFGENGVFVTLADGFDVVAAQDPAGAEPLAGDGIGDTGFQGDGGGGDIFAEGALPNHAVDALIDLFPAEGDAFVPFGGGGGLTTAFLPEAGGFGGGAFALDDMGVQLHALMPGTLEELGTGTFIV